MRRRRGEKKRRDRTSEKHDRGWKPRELGILASASWLATLATWAVGWLIRRGLIGAGPHLQLDLRVLLLVVIIHAAAIVFTITWLRSVAKLRNERLRLNSRDSAAVRYQSQREAGPARETRKRRQSSSRA